MLSRNYTKSVVNCLITKKSRNVCTPTTLCDFETQQSKPHIKKTAPIPKTLYGGRHTVTMFPGHGVGPQLSNYLVQLFKMTGVPVDFEIIDIDPEREDNTELDDAITAVKRNGVAIKGQIYTKSKDHTTRLRNLAMRTDLDLYSFVVWVKSYPGVPAKHKNLDLILIRQNTEGEYSMLEHSPVKGVVHCYKIITEENSCRIATFAFEYARKHKRKKVTTVHKANIMKMSDGLFLQACRQVALKYPDIEHNDLIIDNCCMQLVHNPKQFDIILTPSLYGLIVTNVACGISGGPGLYSGRNYGEHYTIFEPALRCTASWLAGKNMANPVTMLNAGVDLLYYLGDTVYARKLEMAIHRTLNEDRVHTEDLGGCATSDDVVNCVISHMLDDK